MRNELDPDAGKVEELLDEWWAARGSSRRI